MCGIIGYIGNESCAPILMSGLKLLEYRGYDSAGIAVHDGAKMELVRAVGKIDQLVSKLSGFCPAGTLGIGHTRWATHGAPSERNAHPHVVGRVALVHNGIIENHSELRQSLIAQGRQIKSDTDSELVAHLVDEHLSHGMSLRDAVRQSLRELRGSYALCVIDREDAQSLVVAKHASPLVVGVTDDAAFCSSDLPALAKHASSAACLEDGDVAVLSRGSLEITDASGAVVHREAQVLSWTPEMTDKAGHPHYMLKEIHEQPAALRNTLAGMTDPARLSASLDAAGLSAQLCRDIDRVVLVACGTSHHATLLARYFIEELAGVSTMAEIASELRNRKAVLSSRDLVVVVSQSGETLDTLEAMRVAKRSGARILAITNVQHSALAREAHHRLFTHAGPEIGVASTKCFTAQVAMLLATAIHLGLSRDALPVARAEELCAALTRLPEQMEHTIRTSIEPARALAERFAQCRDMLFLGRGVSFPVAMEAALKVKEITYVHANGYPAGELKHGPIALVDSDMPIVVVAPRDGSYERTMSNLQEVAARGARLVLVSSTPDAHTESLCEATFSLPQTDELLSPFVSVIPLQLFSYELALKRGLDVDQPRNLAKTVTVE